MSSLLFFLTIECVVGSFWNSTNISWSDWRDYYDHYFSGFYDEISFNASFIDIIDQSMDVYMEFDCGYSCPSSSLNILRIKHDTHTFLSLSVTNRTLYTIQVYDNFYSIGNSSSPSINVTLRITSNGVFSLLRAKSMQIPIYREFAHVLNISNNNITSSISYLNSSLFSNASISRIEIDSPVLMEPIGCNDWKAFWMEDLKNHTTLPIYHFDSPGNMSIIIRASNNFDCNSHGYLYSAYSMQTMPNCYASEPFIQPLPAGRYYISFPEFPYQFWNYSDEYSFRLNCHNGYDIPYIECGDIFQGESTSPGVWEYYYLNVTSPQKLSIETCKSDPDLDTDLWLLAPGFPWNKLYVADDYVECDLGYPNLVIDTLPPGQYLLEIGHWWLDPESFQYYGEYQCSTPSSYTCGSVITGIIPDSDIIDYVIAMNLNVSQTIAVDYVLPTGCCTDMTLSYAYDTEMLLTSTHITSDIGSGYYSKISTAIFFEPVRMGQYLLHFERNNWPNHNEDQEYEINILCYTNFEEYNEPYMVIEAEDVTFMEAELECESTFGTTIAIINKEEDLLTAINTVHQKYPFAADSLWVYLYAIYLPAFSDSKAHAIAFHPYVYYLPGRKENFTTYFDQIRIVVEPENFNEFDPWDSFSPHGKGMLCNSMYKCISYISHRYPY